MNCAKSRCTVERGLEQLQPGNLIANTGIVLLIVHKKEESEMSHLGQVTQDTLNKQAFATYC
jgi:hypothetical protein